MKENYLIIMAGGIGSRFWPMSTEQHPKQFIDILGTGKTMLQDTVERFGDLIPGENVYIVTNKIYYDLVKQQLPYLTDDQILLEPVMRNTAPCIAYACGKIAVKSPRANIVVSPSDHVIRNAQEFRNTIQQSLDFVSQHDNIVTLGIQPDYPATGYGYIKKSAHNSVGFYKVEAFKEKPNEQVATGYVNSGEYFWNSGIFIWRADIINGAIAEFLPEMSQNFAQIQHTYYTADEQEAINTHFPKCQNISVDYGIMEKAHNVYVLPSDFGWSDLGTWRSLHELSEKDDKLNVLSGKAVAVDSENCIIKVSEGKRIVVQGLSDYIVVESNGNILICRKDQEQRIKEFTQLAKEKFD